MDEFERQLDQPIVRQIKELLPKNITVYLVGGAVRDAFLGHTGYDLDFVTGPDAMMLARRLADELGGAYFPLDAKRKVARLVLKPGDRYGLVAEHPIRVDFSAYQGPDLEADLQGRDFTINAMAWDIHQPNRLVDPLKGAADLASRKLRACSDRSFENDPIRILRAVRFSVGLKLSIVPDTLRDMRKAASGLKRVSAERVRDELFRILTTKHPATSLRILDNLDVLGYFLPELVGLKAVNQSSPHIWDAFNHTLEVVERLEDVLDILRIEINPAKVDNLLMGLLTINLGRFRTQVEEHIAQSLNPDRPHRGILFFAGLYHDVGKQSTQTIDETGRTRFLEHEHVGATTVKQRGEALRLSNDEISWLATIVKNHMRPSLLSHSGENISSRAIYRFFRDTGAAGVDICLLSLADMLATYGPTLPQERWARHLEVIRSLLQAWWEKKDERIFPPPLVSGNELMTELGISSGPQVGYLLDAIREAQVSQEIFTKDDAIKLAEQLVVNHNENGLPK